MDRTMKTLLVLLVLPFAVLADRPEGDYIVVLQTNESPRIVLRDHGMGAKHQWTNALHGFHVHANSSQLARLDRDTRVLVIETNAPCHALAQTIPTGIRRIGCLSNALWKASIATPINADVAVLDTGIDLTHPDLNVYQHVSFITNNSTGNDDNGHGTHCAGIIGAKNDLNGVVGVAPGCRLWAVKVLDVNGNGSISSIVSGVDYVTQHASEIEVANMSFGGNGMSDSVRLAIQGSVARGIVYVAAAGNDGQDIYGGDWALGTSDDYWPASYPEVMTVSALTDSDGMGGGIGVSTAFGPDDTLATFSNYSHSVVADNPVFSPGAGIDVAAPGVNIYSTYKGGSYATLSGTSMACPHAAGVLALYCAAYGRATDATGVAAIRQGIIDRSEPQNTWGVNPTNPFPNDHNPEGLVSVLQIGQSFTPTGNPPVVAITSPANAEIYTASQTVTFSGTATDTEDGTLSPSLLWNSSIQGQIGTGPSFSRTLSSGNHVISAYVRDSSGNIGHASVSLIVQVTGNNPPLLSISSPTNNDVFSSGSTITFTGSATDAEDGNISSAIRWYYGTSLIGTGASTSAAFGVGTYTIQACVTDSGFSSSTNQVTIQVTNTPPIPPPSTNYPPNISIISPSSGTSVPQGTQVTASANASDREDGDLSSLIRWTDSLDGSEGTGSITIYTPTVGSHVLTAKVVDSGLLTNSASINISVISTNPPPPTPQLTATISADRPSYVNKQKAYFTVTVRANGIPVSGVSCSIMLRNSRGKVSYASPNPTITGTAGTATANWTVNSRSFGTGTVTATATVTKTGYLGSQSLPVTFTILK